MRLFNVLVCAWVVVSIVTAQDSPSNLATKGQLFSVPVTPTYQWDAHITSTGTLQRAAWYELVVQNAQNQTIFRKWYTAPEVCQDTTCSVQPNSTGYSFPWTNGIYGWRVRSWLPGSGMSDFSDDQTFQINHQPPNAPMSLQVDTSLGSLRLLWNNDPFANQFQVWIGTATLDKELHNAIYTHTPEMCDTIQCTLLPNVTLENGDYLVYLRSSGSGGDSQGGLKNSGWSFPVKVTLDLASPPPPSGLIALYTESGSPTFTWARTPNASWYQIWIARNVDNNYVILENNWYPANQLDCQANTLCTITPASLFLNDNDQIFWSVRAWGPGGTSTGTDTNGWAQPQSFTVNADNVNPPTQLIVTNTDSYFPSFHWNHNPQVSWYNIEITAPPDVANVVGWAAQSEWLPVEALNCRDDGFCTFFSRNWSYYDGTFNWHVAGYGPAWTGYEWSTRQTFVVDVG